MTIVGYYCERGYVIMERDRYGQDTRIIYRSQWEETHNTPAMDANTVKSWCDQTCTDILTSSHHYSGFIGSYYDDSHLI